MKAFLRTAKKEKAGAKSDGHLEEQDADEIPWALFQAIFGWALSAGNIIVWCFTILQWNVIGRSINFDPIGFRNLSRDGGNDSIVIKYHRNKKDQAGENTSPKNCYANPNNPTVCLFLALGCYLCINRENYSSSDKLFRKKGKDRSVLASYCIALKNMI